MPGIFGAFGRGIDLEGVLRRMETQLSEVERVSVEVAHGESWCLGIAYHKSRSGSVYLPGKDYSLMFDGWIFGTQNVIGRLRELVDEIRSGGLDSVRDLNGQFNLAVIEHQRDTCYLLSDRAGSRQLFYHEDAKGNFFFAPEAKSILAAADLKPLLNENQVFNQLSFSRLWLEDETFFSGIKCFKPASVAEWCDQKVRMSEYWRWRHHTDELSLADLVQSTHEKVEGAVENVLASVSGSMGLMLSGGLDSRLILAAFGAKDRDRLKCYTLGAGRERDEVRIASDVARAAGSEWKYLGLEPADFVQYATNGHRVLEGLDLFQQSFALKHGAAISDQSSVVTNGLYLDIVLGGSQLRADVIDAPDDHELAKSYLVERYSYFGREQFKGFFNRKGAEDIWDAQAARLCEIYDGCQSVKAADRFDETVWFTRIWRYLVTRQYWGRVFYEDISPSFDYGLVEHTLRIPTAARRDYRFYQELLKSFDESMLDIEYANTGLPASAPIGLWQEGYRIEKSKEDLYRKMYRETDGKVFRSYDRYFSNFDEWLRMDPHWRSFRDELLRSEDSRIIDYVKREWVEELIGEHESARAAKYSQIIQLLTLELTLRTFF